MVQDTRSGLAAVVWIGNAAAVLCGAHGDVTAQARAANCSRQTAYRHADAVLDALQQARQPGPDLARQRLDPADMDKARSLAQRLSDESFAVREKASADLIALGAPAVSVLHTAAKDEDPEVSRRARDCLETGGGALARPASSRRRRRGTAGPAARCGRNRCR
jgi:hypothetical protein